MLPPVIEAPASVTEDFQVFSEPQTPSAHVSADDLLEPPPDPPQPDAISIAASGTTSNDRRNHGIAAQPTRSGAAWPSSTGDDPVHQVETLAAVGDQQHRAVAGRGEGVANNRLRSLRVEVGRR